MSLTLIINIRIAAVLVVLTSFFTLHGQNDSLQNTDSKLPKFLNNPSKQRLFTASLSYQQPIPTGNNFIGNGYSGENGYSFSMSVFVYKHLFLGYNFGNSRFDVKNTQVIGNFQSSRVTENLFFVGYEFFPFKDFRIGAKIGFAGEVDFKNRVENDIRFKDTGNLTAYGIYVNYKLTKHLFAYADYSLRQTKTNINVPAQLESVFNKGQYHTVNIGVTLSLGNKSLFGTVKNMVKK